MNKHRDLVTNFDIVGSEFDYYYVHFQTNTLGKCINPLIPHSSSYGQPTPLQSCKSCFSTQFLFLERDSIHIFPTHQTHPTSNLF